MVGYPDRVPLKSKHGLSHLFGILSVFQDLLRADAYFRIGVLKGPGD